MAKFFYYCLLHGACTAIKGGPVFIYFDELPSEFSLSDFKKILNNSISTKFGYSEMVRAVETRRSHSENMIQFVDILIGAIGYHFEGAHLLPTAKQAKVQLAEFICDHFDLETLGKQTRSSLRTFNIWDFKFSQ